MSLSLYDTTVKTFIQQLRNLSACLQIAEKWCEDNGKPHAELLEARLAPDMFPLPYQVRTAANQTRNGTLLNNDRWTWTTSHAKPEDDNSFAGLQAKIQGTVEWLQGISAEDVEGGEAMPVEVWPSGEVGKGPRFNFNSGHKMLTQVVFPQFWFHESMAYAICRMKGVPLGKVNFLIGGGPLEE